MYSKEVAKILQSNEVAYKLYAKANKYKYKKVVLSLLYAIVSLISIYSINKYIMDDDVIFLSILIGISTVLSIIITISRSGLSNDEISYVNTVLKGNKSICSGFSLFKEGSTYFVLDSRSKTVL